MKYSSNNKPLVCMLTNSTCYKSTSKMNVKGVLWHSTGANNPSISRYVQPYETDSNYKEMVSLLGKNTYGNDWNHIYLQAGVNAFIGKLADGTITTVQTLPWDYKPWGCGSGYKGSCNNGWIQFEICEDNLTDPIYFNKVYEEACELTAYLCRMYNLDPCGIIDYNGVEVPVILCHADSYKLGLGGNHGDVLHWFKRHNKTMDDVRKDVLKLMGKTTDTSSSRPSDSTSIVVTKTTKNRIDTVKEVQTWANKNYGAGLVVDGICGKNTKKALIKILQTELNQTYGSKLIVDGIWGDKTKAACPILKKGSKNDVVGVLQALLICAGYNRAYLDKSYGAETFLAVRAYQEKNNLVVDGIVGKNTFAKLCS